MLVAGEVMLGFGVEQYVAVFYHTMRCIYRRIGANPKILAEQGGEKTYIGLGLWIFFSPAASGGCPQREGFSGTFKPLV